MKRIDKNTKLIIHKSSWFEILYNRIYWWIQYNIFKTPMWDKGVYLEIKYFSVIPIGFKKLGK